MVARQGAFSSPPASNMSGAESRAQVANLPLACSLLATDRLLRWDAARRHPESWTWQLTDQALFGLSLLRRGASGLEVKRAIALLDDMAMHAAAVGRAPREELAALPRRIPSDTHPREREDA